MDEFHLQFSFTEIQQPHLLDQILSESINKEQQAVNTRLLSLNAGTAEPGGTEMAFSAFHGDPIPDTGQGLTLLHQGNSNHG